jgi:hypothetical protein
VLVVTLSACSRGSDEALPTPKPGFCEAAQRYDRRVERNASVAEQITILEKLERNAPRDVAADATLFLERMREYRAATKAEREELKGDPDVERAIENVNRRAINGCGFFESEPGDGS